MLAVVQPFTASPDVASHRTRSSASSNSTRSSTTTTSSSNLASHPPTLQRHQTAPATVPVPKSSTPPPQKSPSSLDHQRLSPSSPATTSVQKPALDIHSYPPTELLKLLAHLLTHIATTNDRLSPSSSSGGSHGHQQHSPTPEDAPPIWHTLTTASRNAISTPAATLTFHARNIPTISLEAYLLRILKYCPTTNHVFLSLLVYFERMSKLSNEAVGRSFVIDSYNIHRLVIAGVTVASKFFSDVFYTNSRYAKVGGLPLPELNQLELQFLLLNDFRLVISTNEIQHYAEQLIHVSTMPLPLTMPAANGHSSQHHSPSHSNSHTSNSASAQLHYPLPAPPHPVHHHAHPPSSSSAALIATGASSSSSSGSTITSAGKKTPQQAPATSSIAPSSSSTTNSRPGLLPHSQATSSSSSSSSNSYITSSSPVNPLDALGGVPPPVHNPHQHPPHLPHTHPPHSYQHQHPNGYEQVHLRDQLHWHHQQQLQGSKTPQFGASTRSYETHNYGSGYGYPQEQHQQYLPDSSTLQSGQHHPESEDMEDHDDADTSTDAGTETSTDEDTTIRAPGTVVGSVWGDDDDAEPSSHSTSRTTDLEKDKERDGDDARMRSP